jgi:hypothetical protein
MFTTIFVEFVEFVHFLGDIDHFKIKLMFYFALELHFRIARMPKICTKFVFRKMPKIFGNHNTGPRPSK